MGIPGASSSPAKGRPDEDLDSRDGVEAPAAAAAQSTPPESSVEAAAARGVGEGRARGRGGAVAGAVSAGGGGFGRRRRRTASCVSGARPALCEHGCFRAARSRSFFLKKIPFAES